MNIQNNISSFSKDLFQPLKSNNRVETVSKINNHSTSAYNLDISDKAMNALEILNDDNLLIFNTDALHYTKDLQIIKKTI